MKIPATIAVTIFSATAVEFVLSSVFGVYNVPVFLTVMLCLPVTLGRDDSLPYLAVFIFIYEYVVGYSFGGILSPFFSTIALVVILGNFFSVRGERAAKMNYFFAAAVSMAAYFVFSGFYILWQKYGFSRPLDWGLMIYDLSSFKFITGIMLASLGGTVFIRRLMAIKSTGYAV